MRQSPTFFLVAISRTSSCTGSPVQSFDGMMARLQHCFGEREPLETALGHILEVREIDANAIDWPVDDLALVPHFFRAKKRKALIKTLGKLVRRWNKQFLSAQERPQKAAIARLLDASIADSFRCERQKVPPHWQQSNPWLANNDQVGSESSSAVILGLLNERQRARGDFDQRLQDSKHVAMKQLAYGASHEINNPLANISTRAHTMLAGETDPDRRFQLAVIHEQAMRAHDMISDMMLFAHPPALRPESVDVRDMLRKLVRELESNLLPLIRCGASITVTVGPKVGLAQLDPTQCRVALSCLIQNAAEAIRHDDGKIDLRVDLREGDLCFEVTDNGVGIDESVQEHLFDPFYSGREAGRGLGFGLSKSWRIASLHGGSLTNRLDKELRTVFELRLPQS